MEKYPLHLKNPELQTSPEVQRAVERQETRTGEHVPNNPNERIEAYIDRLENVFLNPDERTRERNVDMFRDKIYDALIIKKENFPDSYFELQKRVAREQGHGDIQISKEMREQMMDTAIADQKHSLDAWMDYLTSDDAVYPAWFKYYAWNQITKLSQFDKERGEFKRGTGKQDSVESRRDGRQRKVRKKCRDTGDSADPGGKRSGIRAVFGADSG